ncbi:MAG: GAF domain-containing protein [Desulfobacterales bacterium]
MDREKTYLQLFMDVTKAVTANLNLKEVFNLITQKIPEVVGVDAATIRLLDITGRKLVLHAASGLSDAYLNRGAVDTETSVMEALRGNPIAVEDAANDSRIQYPDEARQEGIKSILVVPIPIQGKINGILRLLTKSKRKFTRKEIDFVAALAEQCGIAIENARIYEEQQRQLNYFKAVYDISKKINSTQDLDEILNLIVTRLPEVMNLKACTIRLIESSKGRLELKAAHGLSQTYLERGPLDDEPAMYYILEGEPVIIPDATVDVHTIYHKEAALEGVGSILALPITVGEETIGMIRLLASEVRYFSHADVNFAMAVAEQSGIAIQNAINYQKMKSLC